MGEVIQMRAPAAPDFSKVVIERGVYSPAHGPALAGQVVYVVSLADDGDARLYDYIGSDPDAADRAAVALARDFELPIEDDPGARSADA